MRALSLGGQRVDPAAQRILEAIREIADGVHTNPGTVESLHLDSSLERDAGLDSVARMELLARLERQFGVTLPDGPVAEAETPRDLLGALLAGRGSPVCGSFIEVGESVDGLAVRPALSTSSAEKLAPRGRCVAAPRTARTLVEVLEHAAAAVPARACVRMISERSDAAAVPAVDLLQGARRRAAGLQRAGLRPGEAVAVALPTGRVFVEVFFGILRAGGIPVPLSPPARPSLLEDHLLRQVAILRNCEARLLIADESAGRLSAPLRLHVERLERVIPERRLLEGVDGFAPVAVRPSDVALLQYTSGSTGSPKGVTLTHANVLANLRAIGEALQTSPADVFVSWLPLYHDMGLVGGLLHALYHGIPLVLLSPASFAARPEHWLWAIHRFAGTMTVAPNFAYEICASRVRQEALAGLDLRSLRLALNGAEPVSAATIERFTTRFARHGFRSEALLPVYGLAENTLAVAFAPLGRPPRVERVRREPLQRDGRVESAAPGDPTALRIVSCGRPIGGNAIRVVGEDGGEAGERRVGRLLFRGPSATPGYFRDPEATRLLRQGDWLDSGDLAYVSEGELFVTGRSKDLIIRAGRNISPHALEEAVGAVDGVRAGCVAAFGVADPERGTERLVLAVETRERASAGRARLRREIRAACRAAAGVAADEVRLLPPHAILKTSSGKVRRADCRRLYERGVLHLHRPRAPWQLARIAVAGLPTVTRRALRGVGDSLYTGAAWTLAWIGLPAAWIGAVVLPRPAWRFALGRFVCRFFFSVMRVPLRVEGIEHLPREGACVLVSNHASYADPMILLAALPLELAFVAKREFEGNVFTRVLLRRLGAVLVDRSDRGRSVRSLAAMRGAIDRGLPLLVFPEGTFEPRPGLRRFRNGAFQIAADAGVPVIPVTIRGSRELLRDEQRWFRRVPLSVVVGPALTPNVTGFTEASRLSRLARERIARSLDEPDLVATALAPFVEPQPAEE